MKFIKSHLIILPFCLTVIFSFKNGVFTDLKKSDNTVYVNNFIDFTTNSLTFEAASGYEASVPENFDASL